MSRHLSPRRSVRSAPKRLEKRPKRLRRRKKAARQPVKVRAGEDAAADAGDGRASGRSAPPARKLR
jgi:hypothetical protein